MRKSKHPLVWVATGTEVLSLWYGLARTMSKQPSVQVATEDEHNANSGKSPGGKKLRNISSCL
ncbi:hypothetical protein [Endozoicomonas sp. SESOKO3]|uniref:hypothetical protein n=1 Tax=Endozoicomonas sp. SESOKO3 TaxID=2828744 RepID=UPI002148A3E1|nr:hypothetical protein [Endozoicomonas sp. SESOKO3]